MEAAREISNPGRAALNTAEEKPAQKSLSSQLWGIDWAKELNEIQSKESTDLVVQYSNSSLIFDFLKKNFPETQRKNDYQENAVALKYKEVFYEINTDFFAVYNSENKLISAVVGNSFDWSTYYFRFCATLPHFRRSGAQTKAVDSIKSILTKFHVERINFDFNPVNQSQIQYLNQSNFFITGNTQTDRWGQMLTATTFLNPAAEAEFKRRFGTNFISPFKF